MKVTARRLCIAFYVAWGVVALSAFVSAHGGWRGDVDPYVAQIVNPEAKNVHAPGLLFNRWRVTYAPEPWTQEPWAFRLFVMANTPAFAVALLSYKGLRILPPFQDLFPFGLSYPSYVYLLFLIFGFVQWFLIGTLIDKWRTRKGR